MQRPPFRASYKQIDFDMKFMAPQTFMLNIIVFIRLITPRCIQGHGICIHPWFLGKANGQGLLCIKGGGTLEAAVFSETQFGADQNGN